MLFRWSDYRKNGRLYEIIINYINDNFSLSLSVGLSRKLIMVRVGIVGVLDFKKRTKMSKKKHR